MAENFFDQFDDDDEEDQSSISPVAATEEVVEPAPVDEPAAVAEDTNYFDQFDDSEDEGNFFDQFDDPNAVAPAPEPEPEEPPTFMEDMGSAYESGIHGLAQSAAEIKRKFAVRKYDRLSYLTEEQQEQIFKDTRTTAYSHAANTSLLESYMTDEQKAQRAADLANDPDIKEEEWISKQLGEKMREAMPAVAEEDPWSARGIAANVVSSGTRMAPGLALSLLTANPAPALASVGLDVYGASLAEGREMGLSEEENSSRAILMAVAEGITEAVPVAAILGKAGKGVIKNIFKATAAESAQEGMTEILQMGLDAGIYDEDASAKKAFEMLASPEGLEQIAYAATVGAGMGLALGGPGAFASDRMTRAQEAAAEEAATPSVLDELERAQLAAEDAALAAGGDNLDAGLAVADVAANPPREIRDLVEQQNAAREVAEPATRVQEILQKAETEQLSDAEYAELEAAPAAERTPVRRIPAERKLQDEDFARAEAADQAAREEIQAEAARAYEREQRAKQAAPAEAQRAEQKEAEVREAEYQRELQKGEEAAAQPDAPVMAKAMAAAQEKEAKRKAKQESIEKVRAEARERKEQAKAKAVADVEALKDTTVKALPDLTPDVIVDKKGVAVDREQMKAEREKLAVDAAAGEKPLSPSEVTLERRVGNIKIALETPDGVTRTGKDDKGEVWETTMKDVDYGFIRGSKGADTDQIDAFVSTKPDATYTNVFIVDQLDANGAFDEHKVMVGFPNQAAAVKAYKQQYAKGWKVGPITQMSQKKFEGWVKGGRRSEPVGAIETTPVASEADLAAMQERAQRKGRKKPAIKYSLPEGASLEMTEDTIPGAEGGEINLELKDAAGEVVGGITADVDVSRKQIKIGISKVEESLQGQGVGLEMYNTLLKEANSRGYSLTSDISVSAAAARVYEALERRGAKVTRNPNASQNERGGWVSDDIRNPVFVVEPIDIKLRKDDLKPISKDISEATGDTLEDITAALDAMAVELPGIKAQIVQSPADLPQLTYEQLRLDGQLGAQGIYVVDTGEVYIIAGNHKTKEDAISTLLHEGVAHKGLAALLGDQKSALLQDVWQNGDQAGIERIAKKYGFDTKNKIDREEATEEYIAHLAEQPTTPTVLRRIVDAVRQMLRRLGVLEAWTDADIHALLRRAKKEVSAKPLSKIELTATYEVEETGEVVEVSERADTALRKMDKRISVLETLKDCVAA